jgi:hypothetical protein
MPEADLIRSANPLYWLKERVSKADATPYIIDPTLNFSGPGSVLRR